VTSVYRAGGERWVRLGRLRFRVHAGPRGAHLAIPEESPLYPVSWVISLAQPERSVWRRAIEERGEGSAQEGPYVGPYVREPGEPKRLVTRWRRLTGMRAGAPFARVSLPFPPYGEIVVPWTVLQELLRELDAVVAGERDAEG
jgi:hypothetical protein